MRRFNNTEKQILKRLVSLKGGKFTLIDIISQNWQEGYFELSGFQQKAVLHIEGAKNLDSYMQKMAAARDLIKYLELAGLVTFWDRLPTEDNTMSCGIKKEEQTPFFLTDFGIATDLVVRANRHYLVTEELFKHVKSSFRTRNEVRLDRNFTVFGIGFIILIALGVGNIYANYQMLEKGVRVRIDELSKTSNNVLESQRTNQVILDTLQHQSQQMLNLYEGISQNTENIKVIEEKIDRHSYNVRYLINQNKVRIEMNERQINKSDSLMRERLN